MSTSTRTHLTCRYSCHDYYTTLGVPVQMQHRDIKSGVKVSDASGTSNYVASSTEHRSSSHSDHTACSTEHRSGYVANSNEHRSSSHSDQDHTASITCSCSGYLCSPPDGRAPEAGQLCKDTNTHMYIRLRWNLTR